MTQFSGGRSIPICVTGLRRGEKLYEELLIEENSLPTIHPRIMTASEVFLPMIELKAVLDRLLAACESVDMPTIMAILHELPLEYSPVVRKMSDLLWCAEHERTSSLDTTATTHLN